MLMTSKGVRANVLSRKDEGIFKVFYVLPRSRDQFHPTCLWFLFCFFVNSLTEDSMKIECGRRFVCLFFGRKTKKT